MARFVFVLCFIITSKIYSQPDSLFFKQQTVPLTPVWTQANKFGVDINQVAFVNWNSGGVNSIAGLFALKSILKYHLQWIARCQ